MANGKTATNHQDQSSPSSQALAQSLSREAMLEEQSLLLIIDRIPGQLAVMTAGGEVELVNRQVLEYFGKTAEELKNWASSDAVHPDDLPRSIDAFRLAIKTGEPLEREHRVRRADGVYRWHQLRSVPQRDAEGH